MGRWIIAIICCLCLATLAAAQQDVVPQVPSGSKVTRKNADQKNTKNTAAGNNADSKGVTGGQKGKTTGKKGRSAIERDLSKPRGAAKTTRPKRVPGLTPEREAAAMTFVRQHHPELASLLVHLKQRRTRDYQRAVMDLFRASERLAQMQDVDEGAYQLELQIWKSRSRVELIAARLSMDDSEDLRTQLRSSLDEQLDLQRQKLVREKARIVNRLQKVEEQIDRLESGRQQYLDRQLRMFTRASRSPTKSPTKSPGKSPGKKAVPTPARKPSAARRNGPPKQP